MQQFSTDNDATVPLKAIEQNYYNYYCGNNPNRDQCHRRNEDLSICELLDGHFHVSSSSHASLLCRKPHHSLRSYVLDRCHYFHIATGLLGASGTR